MFVGFVETGREGVRAQSSLHQGPACGPIRVSLRVRGLSGFQVFGVFGFQDLIGLKDFRAQSLDCRLKASGSQRV